jgi:hypothetical protein
MRATITVFKSEVVLKHLLLQRLSTLCENVKEVGDAYVLVPREGQLFELLHMLSDSQIYYTTQFNIVDDLPSKAS